MASEKPTTNPTATETAPAEPAPALALVKASPGRLSADSEWHQPPGSGPLEEAPEWLRRLDLPSLGLARAFRAGHDEVEVAHGLCRYWAAEGLEAAGWFGLVEEALEGPGYGTILWGPTTALLSPSDSEEPSAFVGTPTIPTIDALDRLDRLFDPDLLSLAAEALPKGLELRQVGAPFLALLDVGETAYSGETADSGEEGPALVWVQEIGVALFVDEAPQLMTLTQLGMASFYVVLDFA